MLDRFRQLGPGARLAVVGVAIIVAIAMIVGVGVAVAPKPASEGPAVSATIGEETVPPQSTIGEDGEPTPTALSGDSAAGDDEYHAQGSPQPQMLSPTDSARLENFARDAATAFVTYDSSISRESRAIQLAPYFGSGPSSFQIPILARQDLLERRTGWSSKVTVAQVFMVAEMEPSPGDDLHSARYGVNISYLADWPNENTSGLSQSGAAFWQVYIPLEQDASGAWQVKDPSLVTITEPDIDTGAK